MIRHPFGPLHGVAHVTPHALQRFRERSGVKGTAGQVLSRLENWMRSAKPAKPRNAHVDAMKVLTHGPVPATYWMIGTHAQAFVIVCKDDTIVTVHQNVANEFELKP